MNREFLKNAGVPEEAIDKIMSEHGKDIQSATGSFPTGARSVTGGEMIPRGTSYRGAPPCPQCNCR